MKPSTESCSEAIERSKSMAKRNEAKIKGKNIHHFNIGDNGEIHEYHGGNNDEKENKKSFLETVKTLSDILGNIWQYLLIAALIFLALFWPGVLDKIKDLLSGILGLVG